MTQTQPRAALVAALALLALLGVVGAAYGPAIPSLREEFGLTPAAAGSLLTAHYLGSISGILAAGWLAARNPNPAIRGRLPQAGAAMFGTGCLAMAAGGGWPFPLVAAALIGVGNGSLAAVVNVWGANAFGTRGPAVVNLLNAAYSGGAVLGPAAVAAAVTTLPMGYRAPFLFGAVVAAILVPFVAGMVTPPRAGTAAGRLHFGGALLAFSLVYFLYGGLETASGGWIATHLLSVGAGTAAAAGVTSAFWAALAVGRVLAAPLSLRLAPGAFVAGSLALAMVALALAGVPSLAPLAYPLAGLGLAPVYPTALVWLSRRVGPETIPVAVAASFLGGAAFPPLVGALISAGGTGALPVTLLVISGLAVCLARGLLVRDRPASQAA